jgi:hypothetical protein
MDSSYPYKRIEREAANMFEALTLSGHGHRERLESVSGQKDRMCIRYRNGEIIVVKPKEGE